MSIELLPYDTTRCSLTIESPPLGGGATRRSSPRRIAANRRNALKSTGPRTREGKARVSKNALKHGLCSDLAIPSCEDQPTFDMFLNELREELQPVSIMQKVLFPHIANLIWRLRRLPEAEAHLFEQELHKAADGEAGETLTASQVMARRFSDDTSNGFALLGRYERGMQNMLMRLLSKYHHLKKHHPTTPYASDEPPVPPQPAAPSAYEMRIQKQTFERREYELPRYIPPRNEYEAGVDLAIWRMAEQKQSQSNPAENRDRSAQTQECHVLSPPPVTEQSHWPRVSPTAQRRIAETEAWVKQCAARQTAAQRIT